MIKHKTSGSFEEITDIESVSEKKQIKTESLNVDFDMWKEFVERVYMEKIKCEKCW